MGELISIFQSPFILRILVGGVIIAFICGLMGFFTSLRKAHFYGDVIAHSSLAGIALGLFLEVNPLLLAFGYAVLISIILPKIKESTKLDFNNILGIFLPFSMGLGVIIFSLIPGYQADLTSYLFGSMVWVTWVDIQLLLILAAVLSLALVFLFSKLTLISLDGEYSRLLGLKVNYYELFYNFLLALVIIAGVRLAGIVLINAFLIVPATVAKLSSNSLKSMFILSPLIAVISVLIGLIFSILFNTPSGATIAVVLGLIFLVVSVFKR